MKNFAQLSLYLILATFLASCTTTNTAGRLLATTVQTVDAAMKGWAAYVATGKATAKQEDSVRQAYNQYQLAEQIAEDAYVLSTKTGDMTFWQKASVGLTQNKEALLLLVQTFTKKSP